MSTTATTTGNKPVYRVSLGSVQGAVFAKTTDKGRVYYQTTVESFWWSDKDGKWRTSGNFDAGELGNVIAVATRLQAWILAKTAVAEG